MSQVGQLQDTWPAGLTYVFQGTVAEDASAGTHVCTATITPGLGTELQVLYGMVRDGNTATAQTIDVLITDGTNDLTYIVQPLADTTASFRAVFPTGAFNTAINQVNNATSQPSWIVSGTMTLVLRVTTAAVSVTQTFSVVCRIRGQKPTVVLADTVGTPTLTTNTDAVF